MRIETARHASGRRGTRSWRLLTILVLVAASMLLIVPGTATAHVKAKYWAEYKKQLASFQAVFTVYSIEYDRTKDHSTGLAEDLAPMIGDPAQREQLVAGEDYALDIHNTCKDLPHDRWQRAIVAKISAWTKKASRYFVSKMDQRRFREQPQFVKPDFACLLWLGYGHVYKSFQAPGMDPPARLL